MLIIRKVITQKPLSCSLVSTMLCLPLITSKERFGLFPKAYQKIHQQNDEPAAGSVLKSMCVRSKQAKARLLRHCSCMRIRLSRILCINFPAAMVFFQLTLLRHTQAWCSRALIWFVRVIFFKSISHSSFLSLVHGIHLNFTKRLVLVTQHPLPATSIVETLPLLVCPPNGSSR